MPGKHKGGKCSKYQIQRPACPNFLPWPSDTANPDYTDSYE